MKPERKVITASEIEQRFKENLEAFSKRKVFGDAVKKFNRVLNRYRIWRKFGWMLEDFFRRFIGLKEVETAARFWWLIHKELESNIRQFISARDRFADQVFKDLYMPTAGHPWFSLRDLG